MHNCDFVSPKTTLDILIRDTEKKKEIGLEVKLDISKKDVLHHQKERKKVEDTLIECNSLKYFSGYLRRASPLTCMC